jgi:hypothetical protein
MRHRVQERDSDDVGRKRVLEELVKAQVPSAAEVEQTKKPDWDNP